MIIELPPQLVGTEQEQITQLRAYLVRLAMYLQEQENRENNKEVKK